MATTWRRGRRRVCNGSRFAYWPVSFIFNLFLSVKEAKPITAIFKYHNIHFFVQVLKGTIRDTRQKVTSLVENNEYQYRVCAINKAGAGNYSEASDLYKAYDPIGILTICPSWYSHATILGISLEYFYCYVFT